jgi:RNA polymerase sigma-B factor
MQEMNVTAKRVTAAMTNELGRAPSVVEVAERMNVSEAHLREAIAAHESTKLVSLDAVLQGSDPTVDTTLKELIGAIDSEMANIEEFADLRAALAKLSERERIIIELRFFDEETQAVIAGKLGISQMHVSRIQSKALARLREVMKSNDIDGYLTVS